MKHIVKLGEAAVEEVLLHLDGEGEGITDEQSMPPFCGAKDIPNSSPTGTNYCSINA